MEFRKDQLKKLRTQDLSPFLLGPPCIDPLTALNHPQVSRKGVPKSKINWSQAWDGSLMQASAISFHQGNGVCSNDNSQERDLGLAVTEQSASMKNSCSPLTPKAIFSLGYVHIRIT